MSSFLLNKHQNIQKDMKNLYLLYMNNDYAKLKKSLKMQH